MMMGPDPMIRTERMEESLGMRVVFYKPRAKVMNGSRIAVGNDRNMWKGEEARSGGVDEEKR